MDFEVEANITKVVLILTSESVNVFLGSHQPLVDIEEDIKQTVLPEHAEWAVHWGDYLVR